MNVLQYNYPRALLLALIRGYQLLLSPLLRPGCRFYPSCSQYLMDSVRSRGLIPGLFRGLGRVLRCHPYSQGGSDPA